jgi:hypothetical protein
VRINEPEPPFFVPIVVAAINPLNRASFALKDKV